MAQDSGLPPWLIKAYKETWYSVFSPRMGLRVDQQCPELSALYAETGANCAAYITACNPLGESLQLAENNKRQDAFAETLKRKGLLFYAGEGKHPTNSWEAEPSFLILGLDKQQAAQMGDEQQQNAIIWCGESAVPELLLLR